jgi:hypothetical protein
LGGLMAFSLLGRQDERKIMCYSNKKKEKQG